MLAEQEAGTGAFYVLVAEDGSVLGRFNLYRFQDGTAELGYGVAQHVAGRGVATATVLELCRPAAARHTDPADIGGKPGTWYQRDLHRHVPVRRRPH
jgi:ribosomal-protein-alanine N-acetyltransferase